MATQIDLGTDPGAPGYRRADRATGRPATVTRANTAFQRDNGLKVDDIVIKFL